jgi:tetratricopeptide (TPR) repeat protein
VEASSHSSRDETWRLLAVAAFPFAVYAAGACCTAYVGDSGDLLTAIAVMGIPHPSGYPLYVLTGRLWSAILWFLPLPWSLSLFSAACAAAACGVLYRTARESGVGFAAAAGSAWLLAFSPSFWAESNVQRVYALNALFVALALLFALRWHRQRRDRDLVAAAFLCGLGASNHLEMGVVGVSIGVFTVAANPAILRRFRLLAACVAAAAVGLLPYLYLPLRARGHPLLDWGHPVTLKSFAGVVMRSDFWRRSWARGPSDLLAILSDYARSLAVESGWVGVGLGALAVALLLARRRRWPVLLPLLIMAGNLLVMALHGSRGDIFIWHRYYIPSYLALALMATWGWQSLFEQLPRVFSAAALLPPLALLAAGYAPNDRSRYRVAEDYSRTLLGTLPPGSQLIAADDNILFVLMYLNLGEKLRPDVNLILEGVGGARLPPLAFNPDTDPVFLTHYPNWNAPGLEAVPVGLAFRAWRAGRPWPLPFAVKDYLDGERDPRVPKDYLTQNLVGNFHYMLGVTFERRDWLRARREFAIAAAAAPENDVLFYNLGLIFRRSGLLDESLAAFRRSEEINPREIASLSRPRAADRVSEVEAESRALARLTAELSKDPSMSEVSPATPDYHRRMGGLLASRGQPEWARGEWLRAVELGSSSKSFR